MTEQRAMAEKVDQPIEVQPPGNQEKTGVKKQAKKTKQPKQPKQDEELYLPVLAELSFTFSVIFLALVFLTMVAVSWLTGTSALDFALRTGVAMTVLGTLLLVVSCQVSTGVLNISQAEIEEKRQEGLNQELDRLENLAQPDKPARTEVPESIEIPLNIEVQ